MMKALPNTSFLPVPKSAPAGHTTAVAHLLWQVFPRYPCLEYKDNSGQSCPVRYTWTASFGPGLMFWQKWFDLTPQFVAYQFPGHLLHPPLVFYCIFLYLSGFVRCSKPNLLQMHSSYVLTDPKGTTVLEVGNAFLKKGYRIKIFNTINFKKS